MLKEALGLKNLKNLKHLKQAYRLDVNSLRLMYIYLDSYHKMAKLVHTDRSAAKNSKLGSHKDRS